MMGHALQWSRGVLCSGSPERQDVLQILATENCCLVVKSSSRTQFQNFVDSISVELYPADGRWLRFHLSR